MRNSRRLIPASLICLAAMSAAAQDDAFVRLDATNKTGACMVEPSSVSPKKLDPDPEANPPLCKPSAFLAQGQRNELRIYRRKFLTNFALFIDHVTAIQNFPIEDLNEAANLTLATPALATPISKGAAPKGLSTAGSLTLRTAQDIAAELLNPATASNPANELASDFIIVKREAEHVRTDDQLFESSWSTLNGVSGAMDACNRAFGAPNLTSVKECLTALNKEEAEGPWQEGRKIFTDEDQFRALIVKDNDAIGMVNALGGALSQKNPLLASQVSTFEGDLAGLRADLNALAGNAQAVQDALNIAEQMTSSNLAPDATRAQIKARLIALYAAGTKAVLDDAEINQLTDEYAKLAEHSGAVANAVREAQTALNNFWTAAEKQANDLAASDCQDNQLHEIVIACIGHHLDETYSLKLEQDYGRLNHDLPIAEAEINQQQSLLLSRANFIYDNSQVPGFMQKPIDLGGVGGNLRVYSTIYETETFPRFTIPPVTTNVIAAASPVSLPTAAGGPPPAPTTPATPPAHPSGTPIPVPEFEVHDRYKATMVAAFAISSVKEFNITTQSVTTGNASTSTTANPVTCTVAAPCTQIFVSGPRHNSVFVGLSYHPAGYDTFPGARHFGRKQVKEAFGIVGGLSVQDFNDYFYGLDLQVAHGIQIMGGGNALRQTALAPGFTINGIYQGPTTFTGPDKWSNGGFFSVGLNLSIFRKSFGKITGLGTSTTTTTGN